MSDQELIDRANDVIGRLFALDEAVSNARAFVALLEDLRGRDLSRVREPHIAAIHVTRAGILRGAIGAVMACLDPSDWRGNRASVGQILDLLKEERLAAVFPARGNPPHSGAAVLPKVVREYGTLLRSELYDSVRRLRNDVIVHLLIRSERTPTVEYEKIDHLLTAAELLVTDLYRVCDRGNPQYPDFRRGFIENAKVFWDTYWRGMGYES
jgi:hypothetical protein